MANLIRKTYIKLYHNRPRFVKDMTKTFWCVFRFTVLTVVHLQNASAKFQTLLKFIYLLIYLFITTQQKDQKATYTVCKSTKQKPHVTRNQ